MAVKHIVMWQFKEEIKEEDRAELKKNMKEHLENLVGVVPGLLKVEFVVEPISSSTHDMALVTEFDEVESIKGYSVHPAHVKVADTYVRPYVRNRVCLDYKEQ